MKKSFKFRCVLGVHPVDGKIVNQGDVFTLDYNILELVEGADRFYEPIKDSEDESEQEAAGKDNEGNESDEIETDTSESGNTDVTNEGNESNETETDTSESGNTDVTNEGTVENETSTGDDVITGGGSGESESKDDKPKRQQRQQRQRRGRRNTA